MLNKTGREGASRHTTEISCTSSIEIVYIINNYIIGNDVSQLIDCFHAH